MSKHTTAARWPELHWPEPADQPVPLRDQYSRSASFDLSGPWAHSQDAGRAVRATWRRWRRVASWFATGAGGGAAAAVIGLSLGHAYEQRSEQVVLPPSSVPAGVPVVYPTDLPGLLNTRPDDACSPGNPQRGLAPCDRP